MIFAKGSIVQRTADSIGSVKPTSVTATAETVGHAFWQKGKPVMPKPPEYSDKDVERMIETNIDFWVEMKHANEEAFTEDFERIGAK